jgi:mono/diheme cytochrome c family protein
MLTAIRRLAVVLVLMLSWAATASAQSGTEDFRHYCAACHGQNGKGGGSWNGTKVPDLTRLSQAHGGKFPTDEVIEIVDGRSRVLWHQREPGEMMPYWGDVFRINKRDFPEVRLNHELWPSSITFAASRKNEKGDNKPR